MQLIVDSKQLPVGWKIKYLDKLCENLDSKRVPITKSSRKSGNIPYYGASGIVDYVADYIFDEDLLLVSEDVANLLASVPSGGALRKAISWDCIVLPFETS